MKQNTFLLLLLISSSLMGQITSQTITSNILENSRTIDLYIPEIEERNVEPLPLIVVLEGDKIFNLVVSNVKFLSENDYMPKAIVVGINQAGYYQKQRDFELDKSTGQLTNRGANFKQFIKSDIIQKLSIQFPLSKLKIIIGQNKGANFINYFLLDNSNTFTSYIAVNPDMPQAIIEPLIEKLKSTTKETNYHLFNSANLPVNQGKKISDFSKDFKEVENSMLRKSYKLFSYPDEISSVAYSIPIALETMFRTFQPISVKEFKENLLNDTIVPHQYLIDKYQKITNELGIQKKIILNDIIAVFEASKQKSDAESLFVIGELCLGLYPDAVIGHYFNGLAYEIIEEYKKALKSYERAYNFKPISFISKEMILNKIESLK